MFQLMRTFITGFSKQDPYFITVLIMVIVLVVLRCEEKEGPRDASARFVSIPLCRLPVTQTATVHSATNF